MSRVPPHDELAEQQLIASVVMDSAALDEVVGLIEAEDFYVQQHELVWRSVCRVRASGMTPDLVTVRGDLGSSGDLNRIDEERFLAIFDRLPVSDRVEEYARVVRERSMQRRLIAACHRIAAEGMSGPDDVGEWIERAEAAVLEIGQERSTESKPRHVREVIFGRFSEIQQAAAEGRSLVGIRSGFAELDKRTAGFCPARLYLVAGRPGMGKSAFAGNVAISAALDGASVFVASLEMASEEWVDRMLASDGSVNGNSLRQGLLGKDDWSRLADASERLSRLPIWIDDRPAMTIPQLASKCRRAKSKHGLDLVVVDYLQLMRSGERSDSREGEIAAISRGLKCLAKELHVPVIALAQLNRGPESRTDKRPNLGDLRESGALEQDADAVIFLYRDEVYNPKTEDIGVAELIIGKQRAGSLGTVKAQFTPEYTRFADLDRVHDPDPHWQESEAAW